VRGRGCALAPPLLPTHHHRHHATHTHTHITQVAGLRSNQWPGAACACQGSRFTNIYVGWGVKAAPFVPLPPPPVSREYDAALVESAELPRPEADPQGEDGDA
jgi:hypothetical protein